MNKRQRKQAGFSVGYVVVALLVIWVFQSLVVQPFLVNRMEVPYSTFLEDLDAGWVTEVSVEEDRIFFVSVEPEDGMPAENVYNVVAVDDPELIARLEAAGVTFSGDTSGTGVLGTLLGWILPLLPLVLIWYFLFRRMNQGGQGVMSIGKSGAKEIAGEMTGVRFDDVGGVDEVEVELKEIIDFLRAPERYTQLGAKLPKGVLLVGPPGTGKTLLAKATAGEADVPFFSMSGSDFVEMFVGVGAARVRDLFEQAKKRAPCIVFIDEIDAIGGSRSSVGGGMGRNDEREQTLNQLLAEMDGFESNRGVMLMAATNRPETLDAALLRPGRFDRQIQVVLPTEEGRLQILKVHTKRVKLAGDTNLERIAQITPGFSGADLANIVNEAALLAVREGSDAVRMRDVDLAIERIVAGLQRKVPLTPQIKKKVAYHEVGHALVGALLPNMDPVHKVSIIPTAKGALGYTIQRPEEDRYLLGKAELEGRLAVMLGGRAAELIVFDEPTTGASNDLERATELARRMVTEFGMTDRLGPVRYASPTGAEYLGGYSGTRGDISPEVSSQVDAEIRRLIEGAQECAMDVLTNHREELDKIAAILCKRETITGDEIYDLLGKEDQASV